MVKILEFMPLDDFSAYSIVQLDFHDDETLLDTVASQGWQEERKTSLRKEAECIQSICVWKTRYIPFMQRMLALSFVFLCCHHWTAVVAHLHQCFLRLSVFPPHALHSMSGTLVDGVLETTSESDRLRIG